MAEILEHQIRNPKHHKTSKSYFPNGNPTDFYGHGVAAFVSNADYATITSAIHDVQGALFDIERGFSDCFAQRGVGMGGATDVFGAAAEFDHRNSFGN